MKTTKRFYYIFFCALSALFLHTTTLSAQRGFTQFDNEKGLNIMYKWQRSNLFDKNSDAVLNIRVSNQNETAVNWTFDIGFYENGILFYSSEQQTICLMPGENQRGALAGLRFSAEEKTMDIVQSDSFSWEFSSFEVEEAENCP